MCFSQIRKKQISEIHGHVYKVFFSYPLNTACHHNPAFILFFFLFFFQFSHCLHFFFTLIKPWYSLSISDFYMHKNSTLQLQVITKQDHSTVCSFWKVSSFISNSLCWAVYASHIEKCKLNHALLILAASFTP